MPRSRVLSFMSQWGAGPRSPTTTDGFSAPSQPASPPSDSRKARPINLNSTEPPRSPRVDNVPASPTVQSRARGDSRVGNRPESMIQPHFPAQTEVTHDTPPELAPIFAFLNSHSNKLYQEGYFLKLHDLDSRGRPSPDRTWTESFAQLVGTVLSLWDAAALDVAGEDGEVVPTFINLSDASIKMIESLPMNGAQGGNLQNVLSVSTAANNRYLLHFNSLNSLTQWTAAIRLAMFEHSTLQEAYTGSLIAGKGRYLNNIKPIMERSKFAHEDWARVRFGAGTAWKRCWCVVSPPDEKEFAKAQKNSKKSSAYERAKIPKGDIKFYDTRKVTKKTKPLVTITDAFAAYAIYPQSKPLIDQSTLVKLEGLVTIHSSPESTAEGFVFVMPEVHAAVTGFEMMLRWLFPVYDAFCLYGRPTRLIADTLDQRGLMFAMPRNRRYGYLDTLDVSGLIHTKGSQAWSERQWRRELKKLTSDRINTQGDNASFSSRNADSRRTSKRMSLPPTKGGVRFDEAPPTQSMPVSRSDSPALATANDMNNLSGLTPPRRTDSAPPGPTLSPHKRSMSEAVGYRKFMAERNARNSQDQGVPAEEENTPPSPPRYEGAMGGYANHGPPVGRINSNDETSGRRDYSEPENVAQAAPPMPPPQPVLAPPSFTHQPNSRPMNTPYQAPELRRAHSNIDNATLHQMQEAVPQSQQPQQQWGGEMQYREGNPPAAPYAGAPRNHSIDMPAGPPQAFLNSAPPGNRNMNDSRNRLSMIPGSPYTGDEAADTRRIDASFNAETNRNQGSPGPLNNSPSVLRKPLPGRGTPNSADRNQADMRAPPSPASPTGHRSFTGAYHDSSSMHQMLNQPPADSRSRTMQSNTSSETPDYASTASIPSQKARRSYDRPRTGKLKTVGDPDYQTPSQNADSEQQGIMPNIDFGPTYAYKPNLDPSNPSTQRENDDQSRSRSTDRLRPESRDRLSPNPAVTTPGASNRLSYFGGQKTPSPRALSPNDRELSPDNRQSVAWQPSRTSSAHAQSSSQSLTPEQWVQHRAAMANQPQLPPPRKNPPEHSRQTSSNSVNKLRKTQTKTPPPLSRPQSGDWTNVNARSTPPSRPTSRGSGMLLNRPPSGDWTNAAARTTPPSRPNSRGSGMMLNPQASSTHPSNLTAKEQMHVARATNTPLVNYTSSHQRRESEQYAPGLFGALATREQEKSGNRNSLLVQQAMAERQRHIEAEAEAQARVQYQRQMQQHAQQLQLQMQQSPQYQTSVSPYQNQVPFQQQQPRQQGQWQQMWQQQTQPAYGGGQYSPSVYGTPSPSGLPPTSPGGYSNMPGARQSWGAGIPQQGHQRQPSQQPIVAQQPGGAQQYTQQQRRA